MGTNDAIDDGALCVVIVDKNSLKPIAEKQCDDLLVLKSQSTLVSDDTILLLIWDRDQTNKAIIYIKFRLDDPAIWIEEVKRFEDDIYSIIILNGTYAWDDEDLKVEVFKIERSGSISYEKVWELDISDQN
jgi:hypothetical protein